MNKYSWLMLPVAVLLFIGFSATLLFKPESFEVLSINSSQAEQDAIAVESLRTKLQLLSAVNVPAESERLRYLNTAVPTTKMVWSIVSQLQIAASVSGSVINEYSAGVGKGVAEASESAVVATAKENDELVVKANVDFTNDSALIPFFESLYSRLPLVSVRKLVYKSGELDADFVSAWAPNSKITPGGEMPAYASAVEGASALISGFISFSEIQVDLGDPSQIVNPF